ncbi:Ugd [Desulforapulum autotrophicum HRM2]|uniref:UDP-glucose 6-dehydrogenase n=1 Tax=Desulforapulum autotrophicum (strain ATCC 43914 / DSM 3382 / VKM B-1955 / HRM2) TaxID=177437 RepID=C0QK31_DESAH|nr:UDP-glucose/GDP-mannose dehydrogenase family protein [Desulforapulum autotrophicum]ACN16057.1 Ugd [Desulforapulum autotrophicum HRM2]
MKITMIGTGYVGLVSGACFSEMGSRVTCVDVDEKKIENLKQGILPIYEPGLEAMVVQNHAEGLLDFSTSLARAMKTSSIYFIAVGTPQGEDGSADLTYVITVAAEIGKNLDKYAVIVDKSTVPVGTADKVRATIQKELDLRGVDIGFDVVSNPEFLKEGAALNDFMKPDRIIVGADTESARKVMKRLYAPFSRNRDKVIFMSVRDAEMTKYAANSMLATKISFMNEVANICERLGVDVENVRKGIGSDARIGYSFIYPGCGYGGSCFPKDVKALIRTSAENGFEPDLLNAVERRNELQKLWLFQKIIHRLGEDLTGRSFAVWGLSFKPGTDDMREASSVVLINKLIEAGAVVRAYDPVAMAEAGRVFPHAWFDDGRLVLVDQSYEALDGVDAMVLVTEWKTFRQPDFNDMKARMAKPLIFDGRNQYDPEEVRDLGFEYFGIGR